MRFSFSAQDAPLQTLRRQVADVASVSIVAHSSPDAGKVSIEVKDAPVPEVLASIAHSLDRRLTRIGQIYFLGPVKPEDRGSLVRRVRRLNAELLSKITELFRSEHGRAHVIGDGLVVVADRVEVLERLSQTFGRLSAPAALRSRSYGLHAPDLGEGVPHRRPSDPVAAGRRSGRAGGGSATGSGNPRPGREDA